MGNTLLFYVIEEVYLMLLLAGDFANLNFTKRTFAIRRLHPVLNAATQYLCEQLSRVAISSVEG